MLWMGSEVFGMMVVRDFCLEDCVFCRNSEDAKCLSSAFPTYTCTGVQLSSEHYVWQNPLTNEKVEVIYSKDKPFQKEK